MARYDSLRKLERNRMLKEYANSHQNMSLKEMGKLFNISESRVWRILHNGLTEEVESARGKEKAASNN